jgi:hypothetical protein
LYTGQVEVGSGVGVGVLLTPSTGCTEALYVVAVYSDRDGQPGDVSLCVAEGSGSGELIDVGFVGGILVRDEGKGGDGDRVGVECGVRQVPLRVG